MRRGLWGIIVAAVIGGVYFWSQSNAGHDTQARFEAELRTFEHFAEHEGLLLKAVAEVHPEVYRASMNDVGVRRARHVRRLDADAYRRTMYARLVTALGAAGEQDDAIALSRFAARGR